MRKFSEEKIKRMKKWKEKGLTLPEIAKMFGCSVRVAHVHVGGHRQDKEAAR